MLEDESFIIQPRDPSAIVRLQDPQVIEQILEDPLRVLSEVVTGTGATVTDLGHRDSSPTLEAYTVATKDCDGRSR